MELKFLGRGSAFNFKESNTSAYFIENDELFLIDCGEDIFKKIIKLKLLESINTINLMITHTHSDHVGSIGSLILYSYFVLNKKFNIIIKDDKKYLNSIKKMLNVFGIRKEMYSFISELQMCNKYNSFKSIRYIKTKHYKGLNSYSIIFDTSEGIIYYSGDTCELNNIRLILKESKKIHKLFVDVSSADFNGNPHIYIENLNKIIPSNMKDKIFCMHLNDNRCIKLAKSFGFNVVEINKS